MIKVSILYPNVDGAQFDLRDYTEKLHGDIPNYTNVKPVIQINEVLISN